MKYNEEELKAVCEQEELENFAAQAEKLSLEWKGRVIDLTVPEPKIRIDRIEEDSPDKRRRMFKEQHAKASTETLDVPIAVSDEEVAPAPVVLPGAAAPAPVVRPVAAGGFDDVDAMGGIDEDDF